MVGADYQFENVSESTGRVLSTSVACSEDGTIVVAWSIYGMGVYTRSYHEDMIEPAIFHGSGDKVSVSWSCWGFALAYTDGTELYTKRGDGLDWYDMTNFSSYSGNDLLNPRLTGELGEPDHPHTYLVWEEQGEGVWLSGRFGDHWTEAEYVAPLSSTWGSAPQANRQLNGDTRIYQMNEMNTCINYFQGGFGSGWYWPHDIFPGMGYFGAFYDSDIGLFGENRILSNGPQPTCPCNVIWYTEELGSTGEWTPPLDMTVDRDHYNHPEFPCLESDSEDLVHAFWFQVSSNSYMEETGRELFYFKRDETQNWIDHSELFNGRSGIWCSMAMDPLDQPIFVYCPGSHPDYLVHLAYDPILTAVEDAPVARLTLSATPNPFNPKTTLSFTLPEAGRAELAIFDLQGRRVLTLLDEHRDAGEVVVEWSAEGLASGVYLAQATVHGYSEVTKLILLK